MTLPGLARLKPWLELVWLLAAGFGLFVAGSLAVALLFEQAGLALSLALYAVNVACFVGAAYWLGARRRGGWAAFGLRVFDWRWLGPALLAALLLLPVRGLAALAANALLGGGDASLQPRLDLMLPPGPLGLNLALTLLGAGLLVPLAEELYFRGLLHGWLAERLSLWPRVLFSSALFALGHFDNAGVAASSFILGALCALALERSRSLWLPILIHAVNNSVALLIVYATAGLTARLGG
ncbi:MAG: CPBP family intramembrane metalloprotease [Anaerolineales bacterium]|nr:CPBP family intramembrane metalloprotease [Anaerolineales bacterium]